MTDYFIGVDWKIPDRWNKTAFLVTVGTAVESDVKSRFVIIGFSTSDSILGLRFFSLINN